MSKLSFCFVSLGLLTRIYGTYKCCKDIYILDKTQNSLRKRLFSLDLVGFLLVENACDRHYGHNYVKRNFIYALRTIVSEF